MRQQYRQHFRRRAKRLYAGNGAYEEAERKLSGIARSVKYTVEELEGALGEYKDRLEELRSLLKNDKARLVDDFGSDAEREMSLVLLKYDYIGNLIYALTKSLDIKAARECLDVIDRNYL